MTKRKPLEWYEAEVGLVPNCARCLDRLTAPMFAEAVYSVSIETGGDPAGLVRRTIGHYHGNGHRDPL